MAKNTTKTPVSCDECGQLTASFFTIYRPAYNIQVPVALCSVKCLLARMAKIIAEQRQLTQLISENT